MHGADWMQLLFYIAVLIAVSPLLGGFMARVWEGQPHLMSKLLGWLERLTYKLTGVDPQVGMGWKTYTWAFVWFNVVGFGVLFLLQMLQAHLPLNPEHMPGASWHLAFNTAMSFITNTNWQSYSGEVTFGYFVQMFGLTVQNFMSAAKGMVIVAALARALRSKQVDDLGNFWADLVRTTIHILLPLSILWATVLVGQGVVQNFSPYVHAKTLEGAEQVLPQGPAASQVAIKQLGTNGGGFFNVNSAHPYENPTPISNFFEMLAILLIPSAIVFTFGVMVKDRRQGTSLWVAMFALWTLALGTALWSEYSHNPVFGHAALMEGKEQRLGVANSILWCTSATATSNGSVNAMIESFSPLAGGIALLNMLLGEVVFGGVGCGLYQMFVYVLIAVFMAGLMVGRTPEYLGKKIGGAEVKLAVLAILLPNAFIKVGTAIALSCAAGLAGMSQQGPHGFSEVLYAFTSAGENNGSAFAGISANTPFYNTILGIGMLIGRFAPAIPVLAIAGILAKKKISPPSGGTLATHSPLFIGLLDAVIIVMGVLAFLPVLSLGPVVEHFLMLQGRTF
jgi:K+-transporting ATPase ATPase A chain